MAAPLIALVTRDSRDEEEALLRHLGAALPSETIRSLRDLSGDQRAAVDIAIVANPDPADLATLPNLKWIHSLWAGVERLVAELDGIDVPIVRLVDPELARTMAEAVLAWTYYLFRDMPAYAAQQRDRTWRQLDYIHPSRVTVGILGLGKLGVAAAGRLKEAGFTVAAWSRTPKQVTGVDCYSGADRLDAMLAKSDILVCLLPLTAETRGLLDADRLAKLPRGAQLINFGRGAVLHVPDLIDALDGGHVRHAVLDVFECEPLPQENPLWAHPAVTVLPHISAPTETSTATAIVAANIATYRESGTLPKPVDRVLGY